MHFIALAQWLHQVKLTGCTKGVYGGETKKWALILGQ